MMGLVVYAVLTRGVICEKICKRECSDLFDIWRACLLCLWCIVNQFITKNGYELTPTSSIMLQSQT